MQLSLHHANSKAEKGSKMKSTKQNKNNKFLVENDILPSATCSPNFFTKVWTQSANKKLIIIINTGYIITYKM